MICNTKQQALDRCDHLVKLARNSSDIMREIIKMEIKDHIIDWNISKEDFLSSHKEAAE